MRRFAAGALATALLVAAIVGVVVAQRPAPRGEWRHYAGDGAATKYSPLDQITAANVKSLQVAWRWTSPDNAMATAEMRPGAYQDTPLFVNGVLYTVTSLGAYVAIEPATGRTLWKYDPETYKAGRPPNLGFTHRGVAYWSDGTKRRIISGTHTAHLISIDAETGKLDLEFGEGGSVDVMPGLQYAERTRNYAINSTPVVVRDVIVAGANVQDLPGSKEAPRGDVFGYDVRTGKRLWTFHSIPQPGEFGHETWENDGWRFTGGTNVWSLPVGDEALGYVYLPFGTPTSDYWGVNRPGNNLFAESLVCLDAKTGKRIWHFQAVHHGLWDYDFPAQPILATITVSGRRIDVVAQVSKQGFLYVFDRKTGTPVWPIEERPVPQSTVAGEKSSPTQPFPTRPPAFERQGLTDDNVIDFTPELRTHALEALKAFNRGPLFTPPSEKGSIQIPGNGGGANWQGAALDPAAGVLFVPSVSNAIVVQLVKQDPARGNLLLRRGGIQQVPSLDGLPMWKPPYSRVTAYDLNAGTILWQVPLGNGPRNHPLIKDLNLGPLGTGTRGAPLATASLLFVAQGGGAPARGVEPVKVGNRPPSTLPPPDPPAIRAFDKKTGTVVWEQELPLGPAGAPMTYLYQDRQYLVAAIGNGPEAGLIAYSLPAR